MTGISDTPLPADDFPRQGRLLGIDFGTKRVGVAVSSPDQTIASPLENYTRRSEVHDATHFRRLAEEYRAVGLVVGLPVHLSGDEGGKAREARAYGTWLSATTGLPVRYWDERYTSLTAESYLFAAEMTKKQRKARLDMLAAQILLQAFLDAPDREQKPPSWKAE